jgi:hypothetical protein
LAVCEGEQPVPKLWLCKAGFLAEALGCPAMPHQEEVAGPLVTKGVSRPKLQKGGSGFMGNGLTGHLSLPVDWCV